MRRPFTLTTRLLAIGGGFLAVALLSIALTLWITWRLEGGAAAVNEAGRLRMTMMRMALAGQLESPQAVAPLSERFDASLALLRQGDPARPLFVPWNTDTLARFDGIRGAWHALRDGQGSPTVPQADAFVQQVDGFVDAIEQQMARWTAALHLFQLAMMAVAIAAAVAFMAVSHWLVLAPLARLQQALARMGQGNLRTRLPVESQDEFGQVAAGFNLMAHALQSSHQDLERKVAEKTCRLEERNARLAALYAVSAQVSEAGSLDALARGFVERVREIAHADAAAVRWSDEANERYMLLAGHGLPETMAQGEHCLPTGACHCGQPESSARLRVIPILPSARPGMPHCGDAGYQTLVLVPVRTQQRVLGEVNLFFRAATEVEPGMREMLEAMASHLATAMEGLRATALEREAAVAQERSFIARELHDSIAQSLAFLKIQTQLLRDAVGRGDAGARDRSMGELDVGVRGCYADVRELLVHFRTRTSEEDIEAALRATLSKFGHQTGIAHTLSLTGHGLPLAPDVQIQVLHMVQEALSNVRKHSGARRVDVRVQRHPHWCFEVEDDGCGFDPAAVPPDSLHVGLGIMRERADRVGAQVRVDATAGRGTQIRIELPIPPASSADAGPTPAVRAMRPAPAFASLAS
ncbi:type IV pili methyl-accepting chemotaxis transducer N-terminal domain-containing protein [Acidovorax sp. GBBC 3334]|uniref:type IV pili methyl-accepting chemotaxis transducer N-terminal domain-containing protein n=1 Tax=Acidovorax sp. GBBC 3334 TaxID=2940496 RepID=UPI002303E130|nr:type IV pili methyl-accepting chemotaxis transducer N-terminal domain-containing protein [Acidovorax sp. GBBC 3334]MDA8455599.1 type IV pili methyl-accepting chemotaxis transducer N-terminal domain-containing protein [Acidovorax sp. GBBC 3334]